MSSAFVKEGEYQQLRDVASNRASLLLYLKREYGAAVRELKVVERDGREVHVMSDGLNYQLNEANQWQIVD